LNSFSNEIKNLLAPTTGALEQVTSFGKSTREVEENPYLEAGDLIILHFH
jgi:hypothetical protein